MMRRVTAAAAVLNQLRQHLEQPGPDLTDCQRRIRAEYLQSLSPVERVCYARHLAGALNQQIARELFLTVDYVGNTLAAICFELRWRLFPHP